MDYSLIYCIKSEPTGYYVKHQAYFAQENLDQSIMSCRCSLCSDLDGICLCDFYHRCFLRGIVYVGWQPAVYLYIPICATRYIEAGIADKERYAKSP